ncbi:hypothetical protein EVAR_98305_1 [Eumeta japonica]|uniref:Uncharacterized protein n=1 Tax=Eumeta variegata TaxID=151549 RepID=A0A4C1XDK6_EUMVA|nr:hypothetical protein EVAR_98305_1 [Eumeta japonica]
MGRRAVFLSSPAPAARDSTRSVPTRAGRARPCAHSPAAAHRLRGGSRKHNYKVSRRQVLTSQHTPRSPARPPSAPDRLELATIIFILKLSEVHAVLHESDT